MNPKLKARMEEAARSELGYYKGHFEVGAQWMHDNEVVPRDEKIKAVVEYCLLYSDMMWSATVLSKLLDCDFRNSERAAKMYLGKGGEG